MVHLASAVALLILGGRFDVDAAVVAEGRAGIAPIAGHPSEPSVAGIVTPGAEVRYEGHSLLARLAYGVRVYEGVTQDLPVGEPLFLQTANLSLRLRLGRQFEATVAANTSYGSTDYAYLPQLLGQMQAALPQPVKFLSMSAAIITLWRLSPLWSLQTTADVIDRRPIGSNTDATMPGNEAPFVFPHQTSFFLIPALIGKVTRVDDIIAAVGASYQSTDGQRVVRAGILTGPLDPVKVFTVTPSLGWRTRLSRRYDFHLAAGVAYNHVIAKPAELPEISPFSPTGAIDLTVHLVSRRDVTVRGTFGAIVDYYVDPILGTSGPRGASFAHLLFFFPRSWIVGIDATFATRLTAGPNLATAGSNLRDPDETAVALAIPVRHRISRNYAAEVGVRLSDRAPNFASSNFSFDAHEAWLYMLLTATSRAIPDYRPQ
jgi:hypothetical protein